MNKTELLLRFTSIYKMKTGGQKVVYKAKDKTNETVALKLISNTTDQRVLQEIDILKNLKIDNIPTIKENGFISDDEFNEDSIYIIEEYIEGISIRDWLNQGNIADLSLAYKIIDTLLQIEIKLEEKKILHRDINPNNIILGDNGTIYLIDFGLAKIIGSASLTQTAATHGPFTPGYAPHEQFTNNKLAQDVRTDLFQIGVTLYECCTGKNPFIKPCDNIYQIMTNTLMVTPPNLNLPGDTKGMFAMLINMLMAKNQSQRPDTASDAMRYLKAITSTLDFGG